MNATATWRWARNPWERHTLTLGGTGDYRIDGIPLAFAGDPPGTAARALGQLNSSRAEKGLAPIRVTNTHLSAPKSES